MIHPFGFFTPDGVCKVRIDSSLPQTVQCIYETKPSVKYTFD